MPQFDTSFYIGQIFWMLISFGFLYVMMSQLIFPMIEEILAARAHKVQETLARAERINRQAEALQQRYQAYRVAAEKEKAALVNEAYERLKKDTARQENRHAAQLRRKVRLAEQKIERDTAALLRETDEVSGALAEQVLARLLEQEVV